MEISDNISEEAVRRRTFAIISHPDAGKTSLTEKFLLYAGAVQEAGSVRARAGQRSATSDWMEMERQRGISISSTVLQFPYRDHVFNLLDTPGHRDFSEDTYRVLAAVDAVIMVLDTAKGIEAQTLKLFHVCRSRNLPVLTFFNKFDRPGRDPLELLDEVEQQIGLRPTPATWPVGQPGDFRGTIDRRTGLFTKYTRTARGAAAAPEEIVDAERAAAEEGDAWKVALESCSLLDAIGADVDIPSFLAGKSTPVFVGSALTNFGVRALLDAVTELAPAPLPRLDLAEKERPLESSFSGFVFKIQANMDPKHRDRIAFLRICSGKYKKGMKMKHVRTGKDMRVSDAFSFKAGERISVEQAEAGDIIGLHNHGSIQIGDTFTEGEALKFGGIPHFAPELFKRIRLKDPLRAKQLQNGIRQLSEEGSTQVLFPFNNNDIIVGAVGQLQFDVVAFRLKEEYGVEAIYEPINVYTARWADADDNKKIEALRNKAEDNLAIDGGGHLTYLAPTRVNLSLAEERFPDIDFRSTREH